MKQVVKRFWIAALVTVLVVGTALFLLKYGMTLSMLWWESR